MMVSMPQKIILGGGVMQQSHLFPKIRKNFWQQCNGYLNGGISESALENMIVPVALAGAAGALGALKIAAHGYLNSSTLR
jgi:fructokinase